MVERTLILGSHTFKESKVFVGLPQGDPVVCPSYSGEQIRTTIERLKKVDLKEDLFGEKDRLLRPRSKSSSPAYRLQVKTSVRRYKGIN